MIKIKATLNYYDKKRKEPIPAGMEYEVSDERAKEIIKRGLAEEIKEIKEKAKEKIHEIKEDLQDQIHEVKEKVNDAMKENE